MICRELKAENLAHLCMMCGVFLRDLKKLDKWRIKEEARPKNYLQHMNDEQLMGEFLKVKKKKSKDLTQDMNLMGDCQEAILYKEGKDKGMVN